MQFFFYVAIGGVSAIVNLLLFVALYREMALTTALLIAFFAAAFVNYYLSIKLLFRHKARWRSSQELLVFLAVVGAISVLDLYTTRFFIDEGMNIAVAKALAAAIGLVLNFAGRRFIVFPEQPSPDWGAQDVK